MKIPTAIIPLFIALITGASAQYQGWRYSGSVWLLNTAEGADLPATASETGFPVLIRLYKDSFPFSQAKPTGEDVRFSRDDGTPLAYQIENWDAAAGTASIWVRLPMVPLVREVALPVVLPLASRYVVWEELVDEPFVEADPVMRPEASL